MNNDLNEINYANLSEVIGNKKISRVRDFIIQLKFRDKCY